jgi:hypothetical protein
MYQCKQCGSYNTEELIGVDKVLYRGQYINVDGVYTKCHDCGREFIVADQIDLNDDMFRDAKKLTDCKRK